MQAKFKDLLHQFKLDVFKMEHNQKDVAQITQECMDICEEMLQHKYEYHFHKLPDANRAEIINMINNYTREAILPPVIEQIVHRQVMVERRFDALVAFLENMLEALSNDAQSGADASEPSALTS